MTTTLKSKNPLQPISCVECDEDCRRHYWDCGLGRILCPKCHDAQEVKKDG